MKQISDCLPAWLVCDVNEMRAALERRARDLGDGPTGEETISPSTLFADAPAPSGSGIGLDERRGNSARPSSGAKVKEPSPNERPVLRGPWVGKSMVAVTRRKQRQPHASAATIDLAIERAKRDHAARRWG